MTQSTIYIRFGEFFFFDFCSSILLWVQSQTTNFRTFSPEILSLLAVIPHPPSFQLPAATS